MHWRGWLATLLCMAATPASAVTLFDGLLATTPAAQGWVYLTNPVFGASATQAALGDRTRLDTSPVRTEMAGYFSRLLAPPLPPRSHPDMPTLDRDLGYRVGFTARLTAELHVVDDRAGFSVIVLGDDRRGVEIGFWTDEIWAQNDTPLFTHGESTAFDTTANLVAYELCVNATSYLLAADGVGILSGPLRDYSSFGPPYDTPDFIFLGDDTSSASATVEVGRVDATPGSAPIAVANTLRLVRTGTSIEVAFAATPDAESYAVTRDLSKATLGATPFLSAPAPPLRDDLSLATPDSYFFVARAVDACGGAHD